LLGSEIPECATTFVLLQPRSKAVLETFVSELESIRERSPELEVIIFGGVPEGRVAAFRTLLRDVDEPRFPLHYMYYIIPYPE
jgi:hypothetical protein